MRTGILISLLFLMFGFSSKQKVKIPPGTVQITERLYFDKTEVSNFAWREFEYSVLLKFGKGSPEHIAVIPNLNVWLEGTNKRPDLVTEYYYSKKYRDYPVVGISHEQAIAFCKWRTGMVKLFYAGRYHKEYTIEYRLPTQEEWEMVAYMDSGRLSDFIKAIPESCHLMIDTLANGPMPVNSLKKGLFGQHHLIGNVSEMLEKKFVSKGGSWLHLAEESRVGKVQVYSEPNKWLGFRCVCVLTTPSY